MAPAYNVQITADGEHGLIADVAVVNDPQDGQQIAPAMDRLKATRHGFYPQQALADGAYTNLASVMEMHERDDRLLLVLDGPQRKRRPTGQAKRHPEDYRRDMLRVR